MPRSDGHRPLGKKWMSMHTAVCKQGVPGMLATFLSEQVPLEDFCKTSATPQSIVFFCRTEDKGTDDCRLNM